MKTPVFVGSAVAIVTPFAQGGVDEKKLRKLVDFHLRNHTDAIIVCGTTGEASTMPDSEHLKTIQIVVEQVNGRIPVVAGSGSNDTAHGAMLTKEASAIGADALLIVTPYYNKTSQEGLYRHYDSISKVTDKPIILYNVPSRTNLNIAPSTIKRLTEISNIVGVKECNLNQVAEVRFLCGDDVVIYSGEDGVVIPMLSLGAKGVISVAANVAPALMSQMVHAYLQGDTQTAMNIQISIVPLVQALFSDVNPIPVKEALNILGWDIGHCRLPLCDMSSEARKNLTSVLNTYDLTSHSVEIAGGIS
ncbi:MAG: 4-hydroxy-tetrahydrodipicolinate synthase [Clostridiaceae bacterium]|nr:4-hydroxy-tetrahydrodipicolinate synthase [Clostridiaceae bacterium]